MQDDKLDEVYEALGLTPLDKFLQGTTGDRRVGATTWMVIEAAWEVVHQKKVVLVGQNMEEANRLMGLCLSYTGQLYTLGYGEGTIHMKGRGRKYENLLGSAVLFAESHNTIVAFRRGSKALEFRDHLWLDQTLRRRKGPYDRIEAVKRRFPDDGKYDAFDHRGVFLMTLPAESFLKIIQDRPWIDLL